MTDLIEEIWNALNRMGERITNAIAALLVVLIFLLVGAMMLAGEWEPRVLKL